MRCSSEALLRGLALRLLGAGATDGARRKAALQTMVKCHDLKTICLPRQIEVVRGAR
jgi:hypothetical protein